MTIKVNIDVPPKCLDENIEENVKDILKKKYEGTCTQKLGYIYEVCKIVKIEENMISRITQNVTFSIVFEVKTFLPREGLKIPCKVKMIFPYGVLLQLNKFAVLVHKKHIDDYEFTKDTFKKGGKTYKIGEMCEVEINGVKYENKNFSGMGKFV